MLSGEVMGDESQAACQNSAGSSCCRKRAEAQCPKLGSLRYDGGWAVKLRSSTQSTALEVKATTRSHRGSGDAETAAPAMGCGLAIRESGRCHPGIVKTAGGVPERVQRLLDVWAG